MSVYYDEESVEAFADPNTTIASPLKREFLKRLLSEESATRRCCQGAETSVMTVIMDLVMASVHCHIDSIVSLNYRIPKNSQNLPVEKSPSVVHIATQTRLLENCVRHIQQCLAIDTRISTDSHKNREIKTLNLNIESRLTAMNTHLRMWNELVDLFVANNATYLGGVQAQSVKRLTLLATIFLPISLAASLLSMSTRAADLGNLWYDYFGLSVIALFLVFMGYICMLVWDETRTEEVRAFTPLAILGVSVGYVEELGWRLFSQLFWFLFAVLTLASFVVGMVKSISLGLHMLAYSAAATLGPLLILSFLDLVLNLSTEMMKDPSFQVARPERSED